MITVLTAYRRKNRIRQVELAELAGVSQAALSMAENKLVQLGPEQTKVIAQYLKVAPEDLYRPYEEFIKEQARREKDEL